MTSQPFKRAARSGSIALAALILLAIAACSDAYAPKREEGSLRVVIAPLADSVFEGDVIRLAATVRDGAGNVIPDAAITWTVSDASLAQVGSDGSLTLLEAGALRVTARSGGVSSVYELAIGRLAVKVIEATPAALHLGRGDLVTLDVRVKGQGGRPISDRTITYTSDDSSVALPNVLGMVHALRAGTTTVRATVDGVTTPVPVDVVIADTTLTMNSFNGAALPFLIAADSVSWDGVREFHEVYFERGTFVLSGLAQLRYKVDMVFAEYNVITSGQQITRELRRVGHETDRGIVDVGVGGRLALTSEFISPLAHTADMRTDGYLLHFRVPGDDIIWDVGFRRATP